MRLLLAEDEQMLADALSAILTHNHYSVDAVYNGRDALDYLENGDYDGAILDIMMPKMDGLTVLRRIRSAGKTLPVLLLTAYSQQDIVEKASEAGVIAYLVKPIREEQLFPAMEIAEKRFQEMQKLNAELAQLKESLETRKLLDRAKGILMAAHGMTEQEAYRKMQQFSMAKRISLKALAESIIAAAAKRS